MRHNRQPYAPDRRAACMERARSILELIAAGSLDPSEGYRLLHELYAGSHGLLPELKPMFRLPGIQPVGHLPVDDEFNTAVRTAAAEWLLENPLW